MSCLVIRCRSALGIVSFGILLGGTVLGEVLFGPLDPVSGLRILVRIVGSMTVRVANLGPGGQAGLVVIAWPR